MIEIRKKIFTFNKYFYILELRKKKLFFSFLNIDNFFY